MLYDRALRDLAEADEAMRRRDAEHAHRALVHAQDIVDALHAALDRTVWSGAEQLGQLYTYVGELLLRANLRKDPGAVADARRVLAPLADAWHQAYALSNRPNP
jgi:flagellar protein FliS